MRVSAGMRGPSLLPLRRSCEAALQCLISLHRKFLALDFGRSHSQSSGAPNFRAFRTGSQPAWHIHPYTLRQPKAAGLSAESMRSKSWDEFVKPGAPDMHFVFAVCNNAARDEVCPVWPGQPVTAYSGMPDPRWAGETDQALDRAFREAFVRLDRRIGLLVSLPPASLDAFAIRNPLERIGRELNPSSAGSGASR